MNRRKDETLVHVGKGAIKVLTLIYRTMPIILTVHNLEVGLEALFDLLYDVALRGIGVDWLASLPVVSKTIKHKVSLYMSH